MKMYVIDGVGAPDVPFMDLDALREYAYGKFIRNKNYGDWDVYSVSRGRKTHIGIIGRSDKGVLWFKGYFDLDNRWYIQPDGSIIPYRQAPQFKGRY